LVRHVVRRAKGFPGIARVVLATDDPRVAEAVDGEGIEAIMTRADHSTGTDRVAEVAERFVGYDVVLNVQGDEPFLPAAAVSGALERVAAGAPVGTAASPLDPGDATDRNRVKVTLDRAGWALRFGRDVPQVADAPDPPEVRRHIGVYAYRPDALRRWAALPATPDERAHAIEPLRALAHGITIGVARIAERAPPGVDTVDDLRLAESRLEQLTQGVAR
jgi:3-deoxy-manno-octulosonate cytidylyltransferase (CMP-KDO synthetase)